MQNQPRILWKPSEKLKKECKISEYMRWLPNHSFNNYEELWQWSVDNPAEFWESLWEYFEIVAEPTYKSVLSGNNMPGAKWFEGSRINYAEHIFRAASVDYPALIFQSERHGLREISWAELRQQVAAFAAFLRNEGIQEGDRIVAFIPTIPEATIAFLAAASLGAVWSSCSPDFGADSVIDRFSQVEPSIFVAIDGYAYGGKSHDKRETVNQIAKSLPTVRKMVMVSYLDESATYNEIQKSYVKWNDIISAEEYKNTALQFAKVDFSHPIWVLYSSGTTGIPKAITHSQGGVLMEHLKYLAFHNDVRPGERFYWFTTTGWMMWNFLNASLLAGATAVLYDGSPGYPSLSVLWELCEKAEVQHFGTSAPFIVACMKEGLRPGETYDLSALRSIGSTGSPLPPEAFDYVYQHIKDDVWLCSMSGGTDVCTAFVGGCPTRPVYEGEIQCRALGCALYAYDEQGNRISQEVGEMVIEKPMPSMPVFFWNDEKNSRYESSYFEQYPGIWRHGDWIRITERDSLVILGRSDATLNRQGVRIGTAEIYRALNDISQLKDTLIVNIERENGEHFMPLFVMIKDGEELDDELKKVIKSTLRKRCSPRHVPDDIIEIPDIPYTISGKKMEAPLKKILMGVPVAKAAKKDSMRNPESLDFFENFKI